MIKQGVVFGFALFVVFALTPARGDNAALTNEDILRLTRVGLAPAIIVTVIRDSTTDFDTSVDQLVALKEAGVADDVIAAMVGHDPGMPEVSGKTPDEKVGLIIRQPGAETAPAGASDPAGPATGAAPQPDPSETAASAPVARTAGNTFRDRLRTGGKGPEMVVVPAGRFDMGCGSDQDCAEAEKPRHEVVIARPFAISRYEVTFEDYDRFTFPYKVDDEGWGRGRRPVINISWEEATAYAAWLSAQTGKRYRLPTEAEWEYAARARSSTRYSWGDDVGRNQANCNNEFCGDPWEFTAPAGSFATNAWGLHDMQGNVYEWVQDCWNGSYDGAPADGSAWESGDCNRRVGRGGSWYGGPGVLRPASRNGGASALRSHLIGFRLVQDL